MLKLKYILDVHHGSLCHSCLAIAQRTHPRFTTTCGHIMAATLDETE